MFLIYVSIFGGTEREREREKERERERDKLLVGALLSLELQK